MIEIIKTCDSCKRRTDKFFVPDTVMFNATTLFGDQQTFKLNLNITCLDNGEWKEPHLCEDCANRIEDQIRVLLNDDGRE